jgi:hypothetical protein
LLDLILLRNIGDGGNGTLKLKILFKLDSDICICIDGRNSAEGDLNMILGGITCTSFDEVKILKCNS